MIVICPKCNSHIQEEYIDNEENTCFCSNCDKTFDLSYLINTEEMEQIEEILINPPENVKIEKDVGKINVKFHVSSPSISFILGFLLLFGAFFCFLVLIGIQIFRNRMDFTNIISTSVWLIFLSGSIWLLYKLLFTAFGRIELAFGKENYILQGFWKIGKKIDLDWKNVKGFYPRYSFTENGREDPNHFGHIIIENRTISVRELGEKINLFLLLIKYFRYKAISESKSSDNTEIIMYKEQEEIPGLQMKKLIDTEKIESKTYNETVIRITKKLEIGAVSMDIREFSREEYRKVFPQGTVKTPIGEVKIGKNQFEQMADKDNGKRRGLIGAMRQTLADPIAVVQEEKDSRRAYIFIKSFKNTDDSQKPDFILSVVVTMQDTKVAVSTYKRKRREVLSKIKAGVIAYEKDYGTSRTNGI